ncbi:hypothetical protein PV328_009641 [Microctonus aethiopoides]|uniref:Odorant receptor n=1 Tax=Microctonus aethiopoides TaxID=144406 RepID=A0AA39C683_9HYME|nr:hypothetical protein PV328_009641 [Microctonus aethiopoides]
MKLSVTPQTALYFTELSVYFVSSWPPLKYKNKYHKFLFHFRWWLAFIFIFLFLLPLLNGLYKHQNDPLKMINNTCLSAAAIQALSKMIICRMHWPRLKMLHRKIDKFINNADELQNKYIKKYIDRGIIFHGFITTSMYLVSLVFIIEPLLQSRPFPTDSEYPFVIKYKAIHQAIYIQQICALIFISSALSIDFQVAVLLWFIGIKFEVLGEYCERVMTDDDLNYCINKHQRILWYADQMKRTVRFITFSTVATTTIGNLPLAVKFRVGNIVANAATELFIYAWPGDNLIRTSEAIGWRIYKCNWLNGSTNMMKNLVILIQRSQKPVTITINGFIPNLSLQYYTSFLSSTFSYYTTLRIIFSATEN